MILDEVHQKMSFYFSAFDWPQMQANEEIWKNLSVLGFPNYSVSSLGRVKVDESGYLFKLSPNASGRYQINMRNEKNMKKNIYVHRLVAEMFVEGKSVERDTVDHIDRNPRNNFFSNLRWATRSEQAINRNPWTHKGKSCLQYDTDFVLIKKWEKIADAAKSLGIAGSNISSACIKHQKCQGYFWRYSENDTESNAKDEIWKKIEECERGDIFVSSLGRIKKSDGTITTGSSDNGYLSIQLEIGGQYKLCKVHRLVAKAFHQNNEGKEYVNHIDGNKQNNRASNLEFVTPKENSEHAIKTGLKDHKKSRNKSRTVHQLDLDGNILATFESATIAAKELKIQRSKISAVCNGKRITCGGFKWMFAEK